MYEAKTAYIRLSENVGEEFCIFTFNSFTFFYFTNYFTI